MGCGHSLDFKTSTFENSVWVFAAAKPSTTPANSGYVYSLWYQNRWHQSPDLILVVFLGRLLRRGLCFCFWCLYFHQTCHVAKHRVGFWAVKETNVIIIYRYLSIETHIYAFNNYMHTNLSGFFQRIWMPSPKCLQYFLKIFERDFWVLSDHLHCNNQSEYTRRNCKPPTYFNSFMKRVCLGEHFGSSPSSTAL